MKGDELSQRAYKSMLLLAFAERVARGEAEPHETSFREKFADLEAPLSRFGDDAAAAAGGLAITSAITSGDASGIWKYVEPLGLSDERTR